MTGQGASLYELAPKHADAGQLAG